MSLNNYKIKNGDILLLENYKVVKIALNSKKALSREIAGDVEQFNAVPNFESVVPVTPTPVVPSASVVASAPVAPTTEVIQPVSLGAQIIPQFNNSVDLNSVSYEAPKVQEAPIESAVEQIVEQAPAMSIFDMPSNISPITSVETNPVDDSGQHLELPGEEVKEEQKPENSFDDLIDDKIQEKIDANLNDIRKDFESLLQKCLELQGKIDSLEEKINQVSNSYKEDLNRIATTVKNASAQVVQTTNPVFSNTQVQPVQNTQQYVPGQMPSDQYQRAA